MIRSYTVRDLQARLAALGHHPGPIDGIRGARTNAAARDAMDERQVTSEPELFDPSGLHRIHWHWTAGENGVIGLERRAYNGLVDHDGNRHAGVWAPEDQARYAAGIRGASHTLNGNSGAIGLSVDAMAGAVERPFDPGTAPMTWVQVDELCAWTAELCVKFDIPVTRFSTLSHSEIQPTLGIQQRFKWDINWLPDMDAPGDPIEVGDRLRKMTSEKLDVLLVKHSCAA